MTETVSPEPLASRIDTLITLASLRIDEGLTYHLKPLELTPKLYRILDFLSRCSSYQQTDLADILHVSQREMLELVVTLKDKGTIERRGDCMNCTDGTDRPEECRHCASLRITDYGRVKLEAAEPLVRNAHHELMRGFTDKQEEDCILALSKLAGLLPGVQKPLYPQNLVFLTAHCAT